MQKNPQHFTVSLRPRGRVTHGVDDLADRVDHELRLVSSKRLTLTFDNGPTPGITERVLDILARHGLQATFFVIGR